MSAEAAIQSGRAALEALMTDSCDVTTPASASTFNPATGMNDVTPGVLLYSGPCRIQLQQPQPYTPDGGGHRFTVEQYILQLPVSAVTPPVGAVVLVTESYDPLNVGRSLRVTSIFRKTHATAQRLLCEEVVE